LSSRSITDADRDGGRKLARLRCRWAPLAVLLRDTGGLRPLSHHCQKLANLTAMTLDHRGKFRALRHQHADTIDDYVVNLEGTVVVDEPPINFDRRLAFRADDIRRDDGSTSSVRLPRTLNVSPLKLESRVP